MVYHAIVMYGEMNYWELLIHHYATIISIIYCYFTNFEDYGPFILIASDFSDAALNMGKVYRDISSDKSKILDYLFGFAFVSWFVTRNIFLNGCWYLST
jgi:TLC domain